MKSLLKLSNDVEISPKVSTFMWDARHIYKEATGATDDSS